MTTTLIGRDGPATRLRAEMDRTASHGGLVFVTGEAGVGKTALVTRMLDEADREGNVVASGAAWDREGAPGYWPWVQVVRRLARELDGDEWQRAADAAGAGLSFLLGEITEPPPVDDLDDATFWMYDAVTTLLVTIARDRPLIIALEDLHWADASTLHLLEFVVRHTWFERLLVVGTYRDVEVETPGHPLQKLLRPLEMKATTITLTGLDVADVGALISQVTGLETDHEIVTAVHRRTGGNPLYIEQLARLWHVGNPVDIVPPGIRDALHRHLERLPTPLLSALTDAAVIGPEFHRHLLAAVTGRTGAEIHQLLQQAALTRLVLPLEAGRFRFAHDLVREILYESTGPEQRRRTHAAVARALHNAGDDGVAPAHLAHHAYLAVPDIAPADAIQHLLAAGREASCRLAADEAETHYRRALELVPDDSPGDRASIMLRLADQERRAGSPEAARRTLVTAAELAERDGDLLNRIRTALDELSGPASQAEAGDDAAVNSFRFDGAVWTLSFAGRTIHMPDAKGLHDLHTLLSRPGTDVPVVDLLTARSGDDARSARRFGGDDVLDDTAKEQYRQRLSQLDEEIDLALDRRDDERAAQLDRERTALLDQLRQAAGLGGRTRSLGDEAERSRKTVTARIRDVLRRLDERHPELAAHLRTTVSTGIACRYDPPADGASWDL
ncbi:hypothetical protein EF847_10565 [Actinobacteria bacterium YIM 96077]|uniref:Orc1-like AAA ATPase domain-containing protein n=1 Tax=Phytoactinopolyspora halophila TaxID=1981511 RepID=A0A329QA61_9ACTN|nr:AAA family ATPase [Phytoactinopolyspora halophila]AYY13072.1 hypothetical protein EF847_10565 [Actinobacteria bacterium YIM 96077]RAW09234.1 hypothetical protein DPM12_22060 [Phytoactinopolyspora halophila]